MQLIITNKKFGINLELKVVLQYYMNSMNIVSILQK